MAIDYYKYNLDQSLSGTWTNLSPGPNWSVQFQLEIFQFKQGPTNAWKISVIQNLTFLDRPDFHLADYFCSGCLSISYGICIQATFSRWRRCKRIQIVNFKSSKTQAESTWAFCSASGCCGEFVDVAKKTMKTVSLSSTQKLA